MTSPEPVIRNRQDVRRTIEHRTSRSPKDDPSVRRWRIAGNATLLGLLAYATLQYYFLHVFVEILSLPTLTTFSAPILGSG